jgi:hypothetical protein
MSALAQVYSKAWVRAINSLISAAVQLSQRGSAKCNPLSVSTCGFCGEETTISQKNARAAAHCTADRLPRPEGIQGLLHATSYHPVEVILDPLVVDRDEHCSADSV